MTGNKTVLAAFLIAGLSAATADASVTWSGNGHRYDVVSVDGITWSGALVAALSVSPKSNLASITSAEENDFVQKLLVTTSAADAAWIGGIQDLPGTAPDEGWRWTDGSTFGFTNWAPGEPNDIVAGGEFYLELDRFGFWNDIGPIYAEKRAFVVETVPVPPALSLGLLTVALLGAGATRKRLTRRAD